MSQIFKLQRIGHIGRISKRRSLSCNIDWKLHNFAEPWSYKEEIPKKMRKRMDKLGVDIDGFESNWKKHWKSFNGKLQRNEHYEKDIKIKRRDRLEKDSMFSQQHGVPNSSKSKLRKLRKTKIKELEREDISSNEANEYLKVLQRIRDGVKSPKHKKIEKYLPDITINKKKLKRFLKRIKNLEIKQIIDIEKKSELPSKDIVDKQYDELDGIYNKISAINNSEDIEDGKNTLFHLDLYTELLLSFGKIGRIHRMMTIYKELKLNNLQITNNTLISILHIVQRNEILIRQLWTEYLNDFRKGKIAERPTLELFNVFMDSYSNLFGHDVFEVSVLFRMMTEEFKIKPNNDTMLYLLESYKNTSPPRYKSAQKLIKKMRMEYELIPNTDHYAIVLSTICTKWNHFNKFYKELECVDNKYLNHFKNGIDIKRSMKVFHTVLQNKDLEINSDLFSAILKGCNNSDISTEDKLICADTIFKKYILLDNNKENDDDILLNERFPEISKLIFKSNVCSELLKCSFCLRNYDKAKEYYNIFTMDDRLKNRFIIDCDLFSDLIDGISCDLRRDFEEQTDKNQQIAMQRIKWIENEMNKYDILPNMKVWYHWLMVAKRLKLAMITEYLLSKMDNFICNIKYFEFDTTLLQSVVEALYNNNNMDKALEYYGKYYVDIKLFSHWDLKNTGQKEIDFHGFRSGFSCVALQWILQNEYPPINISKYLLQKYGNKNPNITLVIGQGHHNQFGESRLHKYLIKHIDTLYPKIKVSKYPNNPGQLILNGDDIVKWRKYHEFQVDTLKVNDNLKMTLFI